MEQQLELDLTIDVKEELQNIERLDSKQSLLWFNRCFVAF